MSSLNREEKRIFIHTPKCAGSSMEVFDWNKGRGHNTIFDYSRVVNIDNFFKWCFVRNPWDRIVSAYEDCPEVNAHITSFEEFIKILHENKNVFNIPHLSFNNLPTVPGLPAQRIHFFPQIKLITLNNNVHIDFIGRFERLEEDWKTILKIINIPYQKLEKLNTRAGKPKRKNSPYKSLYTPELINKVAEIYKEDIDYFKYTFD